MQTSYPDDYAEYYQKYRQNNYKSYNKTVLLSVCYLKCRCIIRLGSECYSLFLVTADIKDVHDKL